MGELSRRGVKAFAVLSFMAFTSCAIAGRGAFHLFTPPPATCRTHDAAHDQGREVAPLMWHSLFDAGSFPSVQAGRNTDR